MSEYIHTEVYRGYRIALQPDSDPQNPRTEADHLGKMVCFHRRYNLGDKHDYRDAEHALTSITGMDDDVLARVLAGEGLGDGSRLRLVLLPLYLYDHSGITMKTTPFSCKWDSGQVGIIYATYADIMKAYDIQPIKPDVWEPNEETKNKVLECLRAEVNEYDQYLTGQVYYMQIFGVSGDHNEPDEDGYWSDEAEDDCGGLYGQEYAVTYAKEMIDAIVDQG